MHESEPYRILPACISKKKELLFQIKALKITKASPKRRWWQRRLWNDRIREGKSPEQWIRNRAAWQWRNQGRRNAQGMKPKLHKSKMELYKKIHSRPPKFAELGNCAFQTHTSKHKWKICLWTGLQAKDSNPGACRLYLCLKSEHGRCFFPMQNLLYGWMISANYDVYLPYEKKRGNRYNRRWWGWQAIP